MIDPIDLRRGFYPVLYKTIVLNIWVILPTVLAMSILSAHLRAQDLAGENLFGIYGISWLLEIIALSIADIVVLFAVYTAALTNGAIIGWKAVAAVPTGRIFLYIAAVVMMTILASILLGLFLGTVSLAGLSETGIALGSIAIIVVTMALLGLVFPHVIATGHLSFQLAFKRGRAHFVRIILLLTCAMWPLTLIAGLLDEWASQGGIYEAIAGAPLGEGLSAFLAIYAINLLGFLASVAGAVALTIVYVDIVPPHDRGQEDISEIFD